MRKEAPINFDRNLHVYNFFWTKSGVIKKQGKINIMNML